MFLHVRGILLSKLKKFYTFESVPALYLRHRTTVPALHPLSRVLKILIGNLCEGARVGKGELTHFTGYFQKKGAHSC